MAVFNAVINTAAQVTKVIANPIMAGIVAGLGAMQVGLIMGQPLPALAMGGPLAGGQPALVGEQGPEIFQPNTSGTIIPNHALGGAMNISGQFVVSGSDLVATINNELINENGPNAKTIN
jgi:phage-related minor tail protein